MKKLLVTLSILCLAGVAVAQNPDPDEICIVFDYPVDCVQNCIQTGPAPLTAYVVLQNPSVAGGVGGFEFLLCREGGAPWSVPAGCYEAAMELPPNAVNVSQHPEYIVGLAAPLPQAPCVLLLTMNLLVFCPDCWCFGLQPVTVPSIPGEMAYADGADPGHLLPLAPCTGSDWDSCTMACINCTWCPPDPPINSEGSSWGNVKSLYR